MNHNTQMAGGILELKWKQPDPLWIKYNVDALTVGRNGGTGLAMRDYRGIFIGGFVLAVTEQRSPDFLESLAIREPLTWIKDRARSRAIVESDCANVVNAINLGFCAPSAVGIIVGDCIDLSRTLIDVRVQGY